MFAILALLLGLIQGQAFHLPVGKIEAVDPVKKRIIISYSRGRAAMGFHDDARIRLNGRDATVADLKKGDRIECTYDRNLMCSKLDAFRYEAPKPGPKIESLAWHELKVGVVGIIPKADIEFRLRIREIVSDTETVVAPSGSDPIYNKMGRVVGYKPEKSGRPVLIRGVSNKGLADGSELPANGIFKVVDTIKLPHFGSIFVLSPEPAKEP